MKNPIKQNRIVNDKTFARRLVGHLEVTQSNCAIGQEEIDYLLTVAKDLLAYQLETCPENEKPYQNNCNKNIEQTK